MNCELAAGDQLHTIDMPRAAFPRVERDETAQSKNRDGHR